MNLENILGTEKISKLFIKFSVPAIIAMLINGMQTIIDGIFLGNFVGPNAMASVNLVQPFTQLIIGSSMIISIGCLSFIGRTIGEGKVEGELPPDAADAEFGLMMSGSSRNGNSEGREV